MDTFRYTHEEYDRTIGLLRAWQAMLTEHSDRQVQHNYFKTLDDRPGVGMCAVGALVLAHHKHNPAVITRKVAWDTLGAKYNCAPERFTFGGFIPDLVARNAARIHGPSEHQTHAVNIPYLNDTVGVTFPEFAAAIGSVIALIEEHAQIIDEPSAVIIAEEVLV